MYPINVHVLVSQNITLFWNGFNPPINSSKPGSFHQIWKMTSKVMVINQEPGDRKGTRKQLTQRASSLPQLFRNSRVEDNRGRFPRYMRDEIAELLTKKIARIYKKRKNLRRTKTAIINIPSLVHTNSSRKLRQLAGSAV